MTKTRIGPTGTPYSPGLDFGDWVFLAGQGGADPATGELPEGVEGQTEQALRNVETLLQEAVGALLLNDMLIEVTAIARRS